MTASAIIVERLGVRFPGRSAPSLCDVDLEVAPTERVLVVGPSGGGKSTLLHALTGVVPQSLAADVTGRVRVLGADPGTTPVPRTALSVGWLGQDPSVGVCLPTVEDEVALPLENRGVPREQIDGRVTCGLASVGALHLRHRRVATLSGGEQQRVALAAVLAGDPDVLLLDEPTSMLDPVSAAQVLELLGEVSATRTTLLVEHRLAEMSWSPERAVVLDAAGRVVRDGRTADVLEARGPTSVRGDRRDPTTAAAVPAERRTEEVVLRLRGTTVSRGTQPVVEGLDLDLRRGSVTVVVGPNGSGKSSLLLGLAGFLPTSGVTGCADVGLVFQRPEQQFLARTVASEVGYGLRLAAGRTKVAAAATRLRVDAALVEVGLDGLAAADPFRLSGGQQRRLSVVSMAVLDRPVLLLDEPTFGLDGEQTTQLATLVDRLARAGTAVVLATHDLALASALADQVLALRDGFPVALGTRELLHDDVVLAGAGLLAPVPGC